MIQIVIKLITMNHRLSIQRIHVKIEIFPSSKHKMIIMPTLVVVIMDLKPLQHVCGLNWFVDSWLLWWLNVAQIEKITNEEKQTERLPKTNKLRPPTDERVMYLPIFGSPYNLKSNQYLSHEVETFTPFDYLALYKFAPYYVWYLLYFSIIIYGPCTNRSPLNPTKKKNAQCFMLL